MNMFNKIVDTFVSIKETYITEVRTGVAGISVTIAAFRLNDQGIMELAIGKRKSEPEKGMNALPGGLVEIGESVKQGATRELGEETGIILNSDRLIFVTNRKGFEGRSKIDYLFTTLVDKDQFVRDGSDLEDVKWTKVDALPALAFYDNYAVPRAYRKIVEKHLLQTERS